MPNFRAKARSRWMHPSIKTGDDGFFQTKAEIIDFLNEHFNTQETADMQINPDNTLLVDNNRALVLGSRQLAHNGRDVVFPIKLAGWADVVIKHDDIVMLDLSFLPKYLKGLTIMSSSSIIYQPDEIIKKLDIDHVDRLSLEFNFSHLRDLHLHVRSCGVLSTASHAFARSAMSLALMSALSKVNLWSAFGQSPQHLLERVVNEFLIDRRSDPDLDALDLQERLLEAGLDDFANF